MTLVRTSMRPFQTSIFITLTRLAQEHGAINLAQGFPDFDPPPMLVEAAARAMREGFNQYPPSPGYPGLRTAVARHASERYGLEFDVDAEITVTCGSTEAIWSAVTALIEPGDEVIVVEPFYELYPPCVAAAGGTVRYVTTRFPDFRIDPAELEAAFSPRTRLVILNTPTNPTGRLLAEEDLRRIGELAHQHDAYIISDEAYEHLTYDGQPHRPVATVPECRDRTITCSSTSKTLSVTGWRVGWALAPRELTEALRRVHQFVTFAAAAPLQQGVAAMLDAAQESDYYEQFRAGYAERRAALLGYLDKTDLEVVRPDGAFFVMARCAGDDVEYCQRLITDVGVAALPGSVCYHRPEDGRGLLRFAFCKRLETLEKAGQRLTTGHR